ncbi:MAG: hypothetical protein Q8910_19455, partial [Bacteroidota bacterium]|nr:hypothetical protein [Bacteroidota bacterium]
MNILLGILIVLVLIVLILQLKPKSNGTVLSGKIDYFEKEMGRIESGIKEEMKDNRQELNAAIYNFTKIIEEKINN